MIGESQIAGRIPPFVIKFFSRIASSAILFMYLPPLARKPLTFRRRRGAADDRVLKDGKCEPADARVVPGHAVCYEMRVSGGPPPGPLFPGRCGSRTGAFGTSRKSRFSGCGLKMRIGRRSGLPRSLAPVFSRPSGIREVENLIKSALAENCRISYPRDSGCETSSDYLC